MYCLPLDHLLSVIPAARVTYDLVSAEDGGDLFGEVHLLVPLRDLRDHQVEVVFVVFGFFGLAFARRRCLLADLAFGIHRHLLFSSL